MVLDQLVLNESVRSADRRQGHHSDDNQPTACRKMQILHGLDFLGMECRLPQSELLFWYASLEFQFTLPLGNRPSLGGDQDDLDGVTGELSGKF